MSEKIVFVAGASRGLGKALASSLAKLGNTVYSGVRDLKTAPSHTNPIRLDLCEEKSMNESIEKIIKEKGRIDIYIHNAAIAYWCATDSLTSEEMQNLFQINVFAPFRMAQLLIPHMQKQGRGTLLFVSSIRAVESSVYMGAYSATKAALESMAFDWAVALSPWNISVSVVEPGPMNSGIELLHGSYFNEGRKNPYFPYGEVQLHPQSVEDASDAIIKKLQQKELPFRFQTDTASFKTIQKHLKDPFSKEWLEEQKQWLLQNKEEVHV